MTETLASIANAQGATAPDDRSRWIALVVLCVGMLMIVLRRRALERDSGRRGQGLGHDAARSFPQLLYGGGEAAKTARSNGISAGRDRRKRLTPENLS